MAVAYLILALNQTPTKGHVANLSLGVAASGHEPNSSLNSRRPIKPRTEGVCLKT